MKKIFIVSISVILVIVIHIIMSIKFISIHNWTRVSNRFTSDDKITKIVITPSLPCDNNPIFYGTYGDKSTVISEENSVQSVVDYLNSIPLKTVVKKEHKKDKDSTIANITFLNSSEREMAHIYVLGNNFIYINSSHFVFECYYNNETNILENIGEMSQRR